MSALLLHLCGLQLVGGVVPISSDGRVLLGRRAVPPIGALGYPQGFTELGERLVDGAQREAEEETCAKVRIRSLLALFQLPAVTQVQAIYLADLLNEHEVRAGHETSEVLLEDPRTVDRSQLAFPTVAWALDRAIEVLDSGQDPASFPPLQRCVIVSEGQLPLRSHCSYSQLHLLLENDIHLQKQDCDRSWRSNICR